MNVTVTQDKFLSNSHNKTRLIGLLKTALLGANFAVEQARNDADVLIVNTALTARHSPAVIVSEDVDVLTLAVGLTPPEKKIYFLKLGKGNKRQTVYSTNSLDKYPFCRNNILFLHAFSGCDTTSCFYNHGKKRIFTSFETKLSLDSTFRQAVEVFKRPNQTKEAIFENGMAALLFVYKAPQKTAC
ncbi:hypothetical protein ALC57_00680 [Trachymyrmex cornetzi]|uniref:Uncharacterized protein n=1 Tax=Trachymyrmex cornetzi TaxID=471704 RepID=A0A151JRV1_9HYME|nr:hypothetical protein ALC57_00680 [Trachymyrmex cornetzi]